MCVRIDNYYDYYYLIKSFKHYRLFNNVEDDVV